MRKFKKFKFFSKINLNSFYTKILKFKRTKWKIAQNYIKKNKLKNVLLNYRYNLVRVKSWFRLKASYKDNLLNKNKIQGKFDFKLKIDKPILKDFLLTLLRLDVLLCRLRFFSSIYESKNFILNGNVYINNKCCYNNKQILRAGFIITFNNKYNQTLFNKFITKEIYFSFVEIDYYTKTIIIIKIILNLIF
uniref:Ribosomal protein S4 n=1 Tax=Synura synuroidea TaxID=47573 RepID=Q9MGB7_9STRA|nr:ribosomal protein S4 [Synura synuroidea]AAF36932.1 ribosomal protein S4 [Synura synuroidea]